MSLVNKKLLAIDYGINGGFVWNEGEDLFSLDMPKGVKAKADAIYKIAPDLAVSETVHSFPGQGVVSVATFMRHAGEIDGILAANKVPLFYRLPEEWQSYFTIHKSNHFKNKTAWKRYLVKIAEDYTDLKWTDKTADAALIWLHYVSLAQGIPSKVRLNLS